MAGIAKEEIDEGLLSARITQESMALQTICHRVLSESSEGDGVWASMVLLVYLSYEAEGRAVLLERGVADFDLAVASVLLNFGRSEVTRRSRLSEQAIAEAAARVSTEPPCTAEMVHELEELALKREKTIDRLVDHLAASDQDFDGAEASVGSPVSTASAASAASTALVVCPPQKREPLVDTRLVLASKRKRNAIAVSMSAMHAEYWAAALSSDQVHVLLMLIASSQSASRSAAATTLHRQDARPPDRVLESLSQEQAVKSRESLRCLFRQAGDEVPSAMLWRTRDADGRTSIHRGIARSVSDLQTTVHSFGKISRWSTEHTRLLWVGAYHMASGESLTAPLPGVMESSVRLFQETARSNNGRKDMDRLGRLAGIRKGTTTSSVLTGISRCDVVLSARLVVARAVVEAGEAMQNQVASLTKDTNKDKNRSHGYETATLLASKAVTHGEEPFATPSNNLAQGLQVSESLRVLHKGRDHRGDPTRAAFGAEVRAGEFADTEIAEHHKPSQVIPIVDFEVEKTGSPEGLRTRPDACLLPCAVRLTLSGESPIRLPEAFLEVFKEAPLEARALLLSGTMQASLVGEEARHVLAGAATAASASAKRILLADFRSLWLTAYQVYRVGHRNVRTSFHATSWRGAYPAGLETGSGGGVGRGGMFLTSDRRQHGKLLATQKVADEYCAAIAEETVKQVSDKFYDYTPPAARGVPHLAIPGLHAFLDPMVEGLERLRRMANIEARTVDSLQALPFGPFTEHLNPGTTPEVDQNSNLCFRNPCDRLETDGRSFLPDGTISEVQIFAEPLVPRLRVRDIGDNPYAGVHEHVDSWFSAAAAVGILARGLLPSGTPKDQVATLLVAIDAFHRGGGEVARASHLVAADCCVLLSSMFPVCYGISEESVLPAYALALQGVVKGEARGSPVSLPQAVGQEMLGAARDYWGRFTRADNGAWGRVAPLLEELVRLDGRFDATLSELANLRKLNDAALRACWCVASSDGKASPAEGHPLHGTDSPHGVNRVAIAPVFAARRVADDELMLPRGALVGMRPGSFRSLLALMLATERVDAVSDVQVFRNEGGLLLRPSSVADIADCKGNPRSDKSCSPVGVEGDAAGFGTREAKLVGCMLQRSAWEKNLLRLMPLCVKVALPRSADSFRFRGDDESQAVVKENECMHRELKQVTYERRHAQLVMDKVVTHIATAGRV